MIMVFEGTEYPTVEDEYGVGTVVEPTHSDDDEAYYVESILTGDHDEDEADRESDDYDPDHGEYDAFEADRAADRWERSFWGD